MDLRRDRFVFFGVLGSWVILVVLMMALETVQALELLWMLIITFGLVFGLANLHNSQRDIDHVVDPGGADMYTVLYLRKERRAEVGRSIGQFALFLAGAVSYVRPERFPSDLVAAIRSQLDDVHTRTLFDDAATRTPGDWLILIGLFVSAIVLAFNSCDAYWTRQRMSDLNGGSGQVAPHGPPNHS